MIYRAPPLSSHAKRSKEDREPGGEPGGDHNSLEGPKHIGEKSPPPVYGIKRAPDFISQKYTQES